MTCEIYSSQKSNKLILIITIQSLFQHNNHICWNNERITIDHSLNKGIEK